MENGFAVLDSGEKSVVSERLRVEFSTLQTMG
jgi:hypothetical protein